jgi:alkanesulfonate monooxygenase SsuD/methylene tetrahydromethanopterin reductase-like flavin-dependent oxidoreductase (luciferase family)
MHLNLQRGIPGQMPPPVESMEGLWQPHEKASVEATLRASIIGDPAMVKQQLQEFIDTTQANELIINSMIFDHAARLRSYEIVSDVYLR